MKTYVESIHRIRFTGTRTMCSTHYNMEELDVWVLRSEKEAYPPYVKAHEILVAEHISNALNYRPICYLKNMGSLSKQHERNKMADSTVHFQ